MKHNPGRHETLWTMWWIGQLRAVGYVSASFFAAVAVLWIVVFRDYAWQALLALSLCSFALAWAASTAGILSLRRRLAEGDSAPEPKREAAALLARIGVFAGVACFVLFFLLGAP